MFQLNLIKVKLIGRMSLGLDTWEGHAGLACWRTTRWQTWWPYHGTLPGTWHSDKVVSRILMELYLLVEEVDGSNQLQNSKEVPNLDLQRSAAWHMCTPALHVSTWAPHYPLPTPRHSLKEAAGQEWVVFNFAWISFDRIKIEQLFEVNHDQSMRPMLMRWIMLKEIYSKMLSF